jgi:hypothetical protein
LPTPTLPYFTPQTLVLELKSESILGQKYDGVLSSDDYSVYNGYDVKAQQKCLAHLRRHFKKLIKLPGLNNQSYWGKVCQPDR